MSMTDIALDLENELIKHLTDQESVEFLLRDGVSQELLYSPLTKSVYAFVQYYFNDTGKAPTLEVLQHEFPNAELNLEPSDIAIEWLADSLRKRYQRNHIQDLGFTLADLMDEPDQALDYLRGKVFEIERNSLSEKNVWQAGDSKLFLYNLQEKIRQGQYNGVSFGFQPVDKFTGGLRAGHLGFLLARPKRQKTFFMLKAFIEQKLQGERPILFTLENTEDEIMLRISCMLSGYPWDLAQKGMIDAKGWKMLENAWDQFDSLGEHFIVRPPAEERSVPSMVLQADKFDATSILISQFRYIAPTTYKWNTDNQMRAAIVVDLKNAATRPGNERPVYVEAQFTREGDDAMDIDDVSLSDAGLTDMIGQAADIVFGLIQSKDMKANNIIQLGIIDSRNTDRRKWTCTSEFKSETRLDLIG